MPVQESRHFCGCWFLQQQQSILVNNRNWFTETQVSIVAQACLCIFGCKKDDDLKDVNEQGEYFNCRIEDKYWTFEQEDYTAHDALSADGAYDQFSIQADHVDDYPQTRIDFILNGRSLPDKDTYLLGANTSTGMITRTEAFARITGPPQIFLATISALIALIKACSPLHVATRGALRAPFGSTLAGQIRILLSISPMVASPLAENDKGNDLAICSPVIRMSFLRKQPVSTLFACLICRILLPRFPRLSPIGARPTF